jgi:hypothetical protein
MESRAASPGSDGVDGRDARRSRSPYLIFIVNICAPETT